ncbi:hypothetical protein R3P38DRAFT_3289356 [Favolaschia claudopus]|uniref:Uncharacterized protein n=1 Tax=Favolaschia claudopus TaxID=2862362 RepID=A0AAV9ZUS1_9AGAR
MSQIVTSCHPRLFPTVVVAAIVAAAIVAAAVAAVGLLLPQYLGSPTGTPPSSSCLPSSKPSRAMTSRHTLSAELAAPPSIFDALPDECFTLSDSLIFRLLVPLAFRKLCTWQLTQRT